MKRKAISPLIATILLIVVAVVLVGILVSWGQNFVQKGTTDADNSIDTTGTGAGINIITCDYNSSGQEIKLTIVNSGNVRFNSDNTFDVLLIDSDNNLDNSNLNVLSSREFDIGESEAITISDYSGRGPVKLEIRNSQCPGYFWATRCS